MSVISTVMKPLTVPNSTIFYSIFIMEHNLINYEVSENKDNLYLT